MTESHPEDALLRAHRLPHIWCPGCGLGNALRCYVEAMEASDTPLDKHVCVSGIGCSGRAAGYVNVDSYHTTHGRPIPFATGLKLVRPELEVTVFSGDGDLVTIGGNHLIHAARRNLDLNVLCANNFNYGMTGGQFGATTPYAARTTTTPYGNFEQAFNLPLLVAASGATFVSRWTSLHVRQLTKAIERAFEVDGFAFVEILSPCPVGFGRKNEFADALAEMTHFREKAIVRHDADLREVGITMRREDPIILGNFVDEERPSYFVGKDDLLKSVLEGRE
ncbi:MAG: thiamine pyrophosphate-dependent enzyme [Candidatus Thermoplasmatota archaeon]|nr:thiamine pyrophosphate-dependent enzyme [Candidatus Thermoplasmatota archaeon]